MDHERHMREMRASHFRLLWVHYLNLFLGAWLVATPSLLGAFSPQDFTDSVLRVTAERDLWDPALRARVLAWSNVVSGALIMVFATLSMSPRHSWAQWANTGVGIWLLFAPLVFWSPSAFVYANDTLVGALVITFSVLVPMMPGMSHDGMMDPSDRPPGWTYSPSTYLQRLPIAVLGGVGFLLARHLAAYQMGHVDGAWEPFFGGTGAQNGTEQIITSDVSMAWPVSDAGLGAVAYMFEILMAVMGGRQRWRTMPWMVAMFGIVVGPLGVVSIYFIIIQPIVIGPWCTLCLVTAALMLVMIPLSLDEVVAMGQYLRAAKRRGEPLVRRFFRGGPEPDGGRDDRPGFDAPLREAYASAVRGVTVPWTLLAVVALGVLLMFSRVVFGTEAPLAHSDHFVGALVITVAVIAMAEVTRALRWLNVAFGAWLVAAPWVLDGGSTTGAWAGVLIGLAVIALSVPRGRLSGERYGAWDRLVV